MSKRWTYDEDRFLLAYFDCMGDFIGTHDLGRPKGAASSRVKHLKDCGAWGQLEAIRDAERLYMERLGVNRRDIAMAMIER